jgi:hypothetical protein
VEAGVGLGMRRLSIIDLSTGHQPIHNEDQSVWIVFNGEIYNYRELRAELEAAGHRFYTHSDTETIVHAYEEWGERAFQRLRGMFGIAIWDRTRRALLLARDRAGQKPLHYVERGGRLYFGSEIKSLVSAGAVDREIDIEALDHYLSFLYVPRDRSMFKGIRKLPPGHLLRWRDGRAHVEAYWRIGASEPFEGSADDAASALRGVLSSAVRSHMVSDVPLGAFLSGGVDSSVVVGLMAEASDRPVQTFSIGFDDPQFDELEHARTVALTSAPTTTSSWSGPMAWLDSRSADRSLRRAVRRLLRDPDVVRVGDRAQARHRGAVGRRRRRAVRRLRSLPAAPARRPVRSAGGAWRPHGRRDARTRSCPTGPPAATSCATSPAARTRAISNRSPSSRHDEKTALYSADVRRAPATGMRSRRSARTSPASRRCRRTAG